LNIGPLLMLDDGCETLLNYTLYVPCSYEVHSWVPLALVLLASVHVSVAGLASRGNAVFVIPLQVFSFSLEAQ
jgi:hypothetical protein